MTARKIFIDVNPAILRRALAEQVALVENTVLTEDENAADCLIVERERDGNLPQLVLGKAGMPVPVRLGAITDQVRYLLSTRARFEVKDGAPLDLGTCMLHAAEGVLRLKDNAGEIKLTDKERFFLEALYEAGAAGLDRKTLLSLVWGYANTAETHTLETHLYRLRQKLEPFGQSNLVVSEDGTYRLNT